MKIKRAGIITKVILLAIVLYAAVRLAMVHSQTQDLQRQIEQLEQQSQTLTEENAALEYQIAHSDDDETKEEIARDKLGLVKPGEKIFYDTSN